MKKVRIYGRFSDESEIVITNVMVNSYDNLNRILSVFDLNNSLLEISNYYKCDNLFDYMNSNELTCVEIKKEQKLYIIVSEKHLYEIVKTLVNISEINNNLIVCMYRFLSTSGLKKLLIDDDARKHILFDGTSMYINVDFGKKKITIHVKKNFVSTQRVYERIMLLDLI